MKSALLRAMKEYDFQLRDKTTTAPVYLDKPACQESRDLIDGDYIFTVCTDYKTAALQDECQNPLLKSKCPISCNACFKDTKWGTLMWKKRSISCAKVARKSLKMRKRWCKKKQAIGLFCRETCAEFLQ